MSTKSKRKGDGFERELATYFNDKLGLHAFRAPLSGGGAGLGMPGGADVEGVPGLFIEAKRVEALSFPAAMSQATRNVSRSRSQDIPIVVNRRNRMTTGESYTLLRLDDFLELYRYYLRANGYISDVDAAPGPLGGPALDAEI